MLSGLIKNQDVDGIKAYPNEIDTLWQSGLIDVACDTNNPAVLEVVLTKLEKTCQFYDVHNGSWWIGQTRISAWDAVGRRTNDVTKPDHSAKMAAIIIAHPFFVGECDLTGRAPNAWQNMLTLLRVAYCSDPLIWNAVKNNPNLPQEARDAAEEYLISSL